MSCGVNCLLVWNRQLLARLSLTGAVPLIPFTAPACLPACLPLCLPLPCQPALPALFTTSKPGTVRQAVMLKSIPAARCSSQHCEMASARRTLQRHLLRCQDYVWITPQHNLITDKTMRVVQRLRTVYSICSEVRVGLGDRHGKESRQWNRMLKLVLCLSVSEQFKDTDSQHWQAFWEDDVSLRAHVQWGSEASVCSLGALHCLLHSPEIISPFIKTSAHINKDQETIIQLWPLITIYKVHANSLPRLLTRCLTTE